MIRLIESTVSQVSNSSSVPARPVINRLKSRSCNRLYIRLYLTIRPVSSLGYHRSEHVIEDDISGLIEIHQSSYQVISRIAKSVHLIILKVFPTALADDTQNLVDISSQIFSTLAYCVCE